jgi:hypothetical protein
MISLQTEKTELGHFHAYQNFKTFINFIFYQEKRDYNDFLFC